MTLRWYLVLLILATLLPMAVFAVAVSALLVDNEQETFRRGAEARTLAVLTAIDTDHYGRCAGRFTQSERG
jgi:CHASE1-domain containing sensor protein